MTQPPPPYGQGTEPMGITRGPRASSYRPRHDWRIVLIVALAVVFSLMLICGTVLTLAGKA